MLSSIPISRVLSRTVIYLGPLSPTGSSHLLGTADLHYPTTVLLQTGFTKPVSYQTAGELLPHPFTLAFLGGILSVALSLKSPLPGVTRRPDPGSPDFPPHFTFASVRRLSSILESFYIILNLRAT